MIRIALWVSGLFVIGIGSVYVLDRIYHKRSWVPEGIALLALIIIMIFVIRVASGWQP